MPMLLTIWMKIINAYSNNSFQVYPIGMSNYVLNYTKGDLLQLGKHENIVLFSSGCRFRP